MLNQGEIAVAVLLDYSYTTAKGANPDYVWVNPSEGMFGGYNMLNIVTGSKNKELAQLFIDYYLSYDVQYAEAMDGVDSPVRTDVVLDEEHAMIRMSLPDTEAFGISLPLSCLPGPSPGTRPSAYSNPETSETKLLKP